MGDPSTSRDDTVDALVLRLQDYREADRLVWLLTGERGRVSAVARGARRSRKRFGGHLDLFQRVRARVRAGRGALHALTDCRVLDAWPRLRTDVERYAAASYVAELAATLSREEAEDPALYEVVAAAFALLADPAAPCTAPTVAALAVRTLTTSGFVMDLGVCGACGRDLAAPEAGGALLQPGGRIECGRCAPPALAEEIGFGVRLPTADAAALRGWQRFDPADAGHAVGGADAVAAARALVREVVGRTLRSEGFLWEMLSVGR